MEGYQEARKGKVKERYGNAERTSLTLALLACGENSSSTTCTTGMLG